MTRLRRRVLLRSSGAAVLGMAAGCMRARELDPYGGARDPSGARDSGLVPDPDGVLDLPEGFSYSVLHEPFAAMSDGHRAPGRPDAMSCFPGDDGTFVLMRNHELSPAHLDPGPYFPNQAKVAEAYDAVMPGAVTRLVLDATTHDVRSSNLVLAGTSWNCAGGPSPWGFLSCEETVEPGHGFVFLCAVDADRVQPPQRIDGYGRFRHEAASVDPRTAIAYLTEDQPDACFYRFVPEHRDAPFVGELQALRVIDRPGFALSALRPGERLRVDWVAIPDPTPDDDSVRVQAQAAGAATFARSEGLWIDGHHAYISATAGGPIGLGQVLRLDLDADEIEVLAESTDPAQLDMPDNLCMSPHGVLYVAEDGYGGNYLRRIEPDGRITPFARNALSPTEMSGPCFSPDGTVLFLNLQEEHLTLAIRGPFDRPDAGAAQATNGGASSACVRALHGFLARRSRLGRTRTA